MDDFINKTGFGLNASSAMGLVIPERIGSCAMVASTSESIRIPPPSHVAEPGVVQGLSGLDVRSIWRETLGFGGDWSNVSMTERASPRMGRTAMSQVDYTDVQGLVRFGYGHMTRHRMCSCA